jgi:hypothetical protein
MAAVEVLEGPSLVGIGRSAEVLGALAQHHASRDGCHALNDSSRSLAVIWQREPKGRS